ncbi:hypothetical protein HDU88_008903 [Geranomyces variabilis]|nr:hypothetical protein HDU88_008903 [Geranomyces variabilis]
MEDTCSVPGPVAPPRHGVRMKLTNVSVNTTTLFAPATGPQEKSSATRASPARLRHKPSFESNGSTTAHQAASLPLSDHPPREPSSHHSVTFDDESGAADLSNSSSRRGSHNRSSSASATGISFLSSGGSEDGDANNIENKAPPSVDGREFFRKARAELSYDNCLKLMEAARQFNAKKRNRSDTLRIAEELLYGREEMLNEFRKLL